MQHLWRILMDQLRGNIIFTQLNEFYILGAQICQQYNNIQGLMQSGQSEQAKNQSEANKDANTVLPTQQIAIGHVLKNFNQIEGLIASGFDGVMKKLEDNHKQLKEDNKNINQTLQKINQNQSKMNQNLENMNQNLEKMKVESNENLKNMNQNLEKMRVESNENSSKMNQTLQSIYQLLLNNEHSRKSKDRKSEHSHQSQFSKISISNNESQNENSNMEEPSFINPHQMPQFIYKEQIAQSGNRIKIYQVIEKETLSVYILKVYWKKCFKKFNTEDRNKNAGYIVNQLKFGLYLNHSSIVKCYHIWDDEEYLYGLFEHCGKYNLHSFSKSEDETERKLSIQSVAGQLINGLCQLHANHVIHRDVKPQNLFLYRGTVKIGDLGCCCYNKQQVVRESQLGTPIYSPPQALCQEVMYTNKFDVWSLGVTIIQLILGSNPFDFQTLPGNENENKNKNIVSKIISSHQWLQQFIIKNIQDQDLKQIVLKCTIYDEQQRSTSQQLKQTSSYIKYNKKMERQQFNFNFYHQAKLILQNESKKQNKFVSITNKNAKINNFKQQIQRKCKNQRHYAIIGESASEVNELINVASKAQIKYVRQGQDQFKQEAYLILLSANQQIHIWEGFISEYGQNIKGSQFQTFQFFKSLDKIFISYSGCVQSYRNVISVLYKLNPNKIYIVKRNCDLFEFCNISIHKKIKEDYDCLSNMNIKVPILAISSRKDKNYRDNSKFTDLLTS